jgi:hypothetical protein
MSSPDFWKTTKYEWFEVFCWLAVTGLVLLGLALFFEGATALTLLISGAMFLIPFTLHCNLLAIWHWKERYRGDHSFLWGALFIVETTGWFKLIYLFWHILPDRRGTGRYVRVAETAGGMG